MLGYDCSNTDFPPAICADLYVNFSWIKGSPLPFVKGFHLKDSQLCSEFSPRGIKHLIVMINVVPVSQFLPRFSDGNQHYDR